MRRQALAVDGPLEGQVIDVPRSGVVMFEETEPFDPERGGPLRETSRAPEQGMYTLHRIAMQPNLILNCMSVHSLTDGIDAAATWRLILRPEVAAILEEQ
jgi:hypothetical protein